jgi:hypothetical protein
MDAGIFDGGGTDDDASVTAALPAAAAGIDALALLGPVLGEAAAAEFLRATSHHVDASDSAEDARSHEDEPAVAGMPTSTRGGRRPASVAADARKQVLDAANTLHNLAGRIGPVGPNEEVPPAVRQQKWSALNMPLMWGAAGTAAELPVLKYCRSVAALSLVLVPVAAHQMPASEALMTAWQALRATMRSWGVASPEDLSEWFGREGFRTLPRPGAYFGKRLQEHLLHRACGYDARVAGLEASYVHLALYLSRQPRFEPAVEEPVPALPTAGAAAPLEPPELPSGEAGNEPGRADGHLPPRTWRQLDDLDLAAELRKPVRTVRDSPRWFRASLLSAYGIALREWDRSPTPATWKLVLLVPRMLLQHTEEKGQAGKTAFSDRFKRF